MGSNVTRTWAIAVLAASLGCGDVRPKAQLEPPPPATAVVVRPASMRLRAGESRQLVAQANGVDGQPIGGAEIEYATDTPDLVRVTPRGMVTSLGVVGDARVAAVSGDATTTVAIAVTAGPPATLAAHGGLAQTGAVGETLAAPVAARALDENGNPVRGAVVDFHLTASGGRVEPDRTVTDAEGVARAVWTLGPRAGRQLMSAQIENLPDTTVSFAADALPGDVARMVSGTPIAKAIAGTPVELRAIALDERKNPAPNVAITWTAESGQIAPAAATTTVDGVAVATWTPDRAATSAVSVHVTGAADVRAAWTIDVRPGAAATVQVVSGDAQRVRPGSTVSPTPAVRVADAQGNGVAGASVSFRVAGGGGTLAAPTAITDDDGVAAAPAWTVGTSAEQILEASVAGVGTPARITAALPPSRGRKR